MPRKLTQEEFLQKAKSVHGDEYDYSKVKYVNMHTPVTITCKKHGDFEQKPYKHIQGHGCTLCHGTYKKTTEQFIEEARKVHGDKYDYSKVRYVNTDTRVEITCRKCGYTFMQQPYAHLQGKGCGMCNGGLKKTTDAFIKKAKEVHGDKYDYSKVEYVNRLTKIQIICPEHGEFMQTPNDHLDGCGCPVCRESKLERIVRLFLDDEKIPYIPQMKFDWLGGQSLDFYLPEYNIGIECQGIQHFKPVKHFGGEKQFSKQIELDERKKKLCAEHGLTLVEIDNKNVKNIKEIIT